MKGYNTHFNYESIVVFPAHGKDYDSVEEAKAAYHSGMDFVVVGEDSRYNGKIVTIDKLRRYQRVEIRFGDDRKMKAVIYR